ncbi:MAG: hypothetical protein COZ06_36080 [Armatimonadetes bacterium CG_4_10_14_3_um_filter_66_18]|nr:hypothetical protein [Armatimonadota bacterium]OIP08168.1 MAG: hypothetical protein AUJ96_06300 [Armatimonadetes bacterium CG2_30_66_41]PIU89409.1 MAG: hypothetical protein COS65_28615 [Armatimonadetes bacterium CG06_land_8_20_14_3_00_66_21]PIX39216.1 MAG: hypothetical protein COZ57_28710 [Armatimonadetes bacterium CG_4_8_14_3_um_filter_66_20]PIY36504.1 MAG: hypothetical protein COZ06_36080 [Armatimonadetes bacterium CG_4_10_14_3_um_filter_66_18]PIZ41540.1 MAG: hypothetical protein COY42_19
MFAKLERTVTVSATFTTEGNLSINTGKGDGLRDNLVIRDGGAGNNPVISGSSLKGVVRSTVESILAQALGDGQVCVPETCAPQNSGKALYDDRMSTLVGQGGRQRIVPKGRKLGSRTCKCPACDMFGNTGHAGRTLFHDARLLCVAGDQGAKLLTMSRTHVAMRRDTRTQASEALMTWETVPADTQFRGDVVLHNPEDWMVGAVIAVLEMLPKLGLGAKKTAGYGNVKATITNADIEVETFGAGGAAPAATKEQFLEAWRGKVKAQQSPSTPV